MGLSDPACTLISRSPFANLFRDPRIRSKYINAPLLEERTAYITHLLKRGMSLPRIKLTASMQMYAIRLLDLKKIRAVHAREVHEAGSKWASDLELHVCKAPGRESFYNFTHSVMKWLEFSGMLVPPEVPALPFEAPVRSYLEDLHLRGLSESSIRLRRRQLSKFQLWLGERRNSLDEASLDDVDAYVDCVRAKGWSQRTLRNVCAAIRWFFRYCESENWCRIGIARGISLPREGKPKTGPLGPVWKDVRRMLKVGDESPRELRTSAMIYVCSIYALRNSEIVHLRIDDFDWYNEILTVRRAKRGPIQRFPLQHEVGKAILAYLKFARPKSNIPCLFTTFRRPIRPMGPTCVQKIIAERMKSLGIRSEKFGPHALRHACATQLLNKGFSLPDIADFLGHRGLHSVSIYAKYNPRLLRRVASISLTEMQ